MSEITKKQQNPKIALIIDCTIEVLREHGEQGLSVRKVAAKAGMSLGNLQFYFNNKDELLIGVVDTYFERCYADYSKRLILRAPKSKQEVIEFLVNYGMDYAHSEIGEVFRALWGMANRNEGIRERLHEYYRVYGEELTQQLTPFAKNPISIPRVVSLLISYFDGHGMITCPMPVNTQETVQLLVHIVDSLLEDSDPHIQAQQHEKSGE